MSRPDPALNPAPARTILAALCGGVAAYKAVDVVSRLRKAGHMVHVAMSPAACQFVTPLTLAAVSGHPVLTELFPDPTSQHGDQLYPHLYPATQADVFVLMPATADMIAKIAHGLGGDVVSTSALSLRPFCRRWFCPAMNVEMWNQSVVQENIRLLEQRGWQRIGPAAGSLACGMEGPGRMSEPPDIVQAVLADAPTAALTGRRVLIVSGPTREHLDPVRFIGNPSSGKMGRALAEEAVAAGAEVDFVSGPVDEANLPSASVKLRIHPVVHAGEMLKTAQQFYRQADVVVYAAAVADYRPAVYHDEKLPKKAGQLVVTLEPTPDVSATLNQAKRPGQVAIGFALQTHDGVNKASAKLVKKNLDGIVLNSLDALGGSSGTYTWLTPGGKGAARKIAWGKLDKRTCARRILAEAARALAAG